MSKTYNLVMKLSQVKLDKRVKIKKIELDEKINKRLYEMGVYVGAYVKCIKYSLFRSSILIGTATSKIVLRRDLADKIEVENV